jgi:hypothetical protein
MITIQKLEGIRFFRGQVLGFGNIHQRIPVRAHDKGNCLTSRLPVWTSLSQDTSISTQGGTVVLDATGIRASHNVLSQTCFLSPLRIPEENLALEPDPLRGV